MFCTSLRRRNEWIPVVSLLLQNKEPKLRGTEERLSNFVQVRVCSILTNMHAESKLDTHDINLPLPSPRNAPGTRYLRFILLSSADHDVPTRLQRTERLQALSGGSDAAVVWLMEKGADAASSFMRFQLRYVN